MKRNPLFLAVIAAAAAAAALPASAAQVNVYGRIDSGLVYHNYGGDSTKENTLSLDSGANTASRIGIQGSEDLTSDTKVIFRLESRFTSDTGAYNAYSGKTNRIFGGQSTVGVVDKTWGEVTLGRVAGISSSTGPYDLQFFMDAFGGGTVGAGNAPLKSSRHDNMVTYRSPWLAGFQATAQYSMKSDANDEGDENKSSSNRFFDAGLHYKSGQFHAVAVYEQLFWGNNSTLDAGASKDRKLVTLGGSYRFEPATVFLQAQYYDGLKTVDSFASNAYSATKSYKDGRIEGYGVYVGTELWFGADSWKWMAYWRDYDLKTTAGQSYSGNTIGIATKYVFRPSKTVEVYAGGGFSRCDRLGLEGGKAKTFTDQDVNVYTGITKYF